MHSKQLRLALLVFVCGLLVSALQAQTLVSARILSLDGPVEIQRRPDNRGPIVRVSLNPNEEVRPGDTIVTHKGGRLVLGLTDGTQAIIGQKATVEVGNFEQSPRMLLKVLRGKTRVTVEKVGGQPNPYRVNTPTAVIAVRGTIFDVLVNNNETEVFTHEGQVAVSRFDTPDQFVLLSAGLRTKVKLGRRPEHPSTFKPGRNDNIFNRRTRDRRDERAAAGQRQDSKPDRTGHDSSRSSGRERADRSESNRGSQPRSAPPAASPRGNPRGQSTGPKPKGNLVEPAPLQLNSHESFFAW